VRDVKHVSDYLINYTGIPTTRWCFVVQLAEDLLNLRALKSLGWQNAYQATLGETRDISPYFQFKLWDKVTYANPGVTFPKGKHHPGRYLGVSHHVGDMLTYKVEPERERWGRYVVLDRSAVHIDDGTNQRLKEIRGKAKDSFPGTGIVWKEPLETSSESCIPEDDTVPEEPESRNRKPLTGRVPTLEQEEIYGKPRKSEIPDSEEEEESLCGSLPELLQGGDDISSDGDDSSYGSMPGLMHRHNNDDNSWSECSWDNDTQAESQGSESGSKNNTFPTTVEVANMAAVK